MIFSANMDAFEEKIKAVGQLSGDNGSSRKRKIEKGEQESKKKKNENQLKEGEFSYIVSIYAVNPSCLLEITAVHAGTCTTKEGAEDEVAELVLDAYNRVVEEEDLYVSMCHVKQEEEERPHNYLERLEAKDGVASPNPMLDHVYFCDHFRWRVVQGRAASMWF